MMAANLPWPRGLAAGLLISCAASAGLAGDAPPLPKGLDQPAADANAPALPSGLDDEGPALPPGLDEAKPPERKAAEKKKPLKWFDLAGFWEVRGGVRTQNDPHERDASLGETRLQLDAQKDWQGMVFKLVADFVYDPVLDHHSIDLNTGQGWLDLRQANVAFTPLKFMDVKVGRQILTWGTGDLIFLNDLFPKDWQAFFIGRDLEYLKAPSDALKMSFFTGAANVDVVFTPQFDGDRFIRRRRLSAWNGNLGRRAGRDAVVHADKPDDCFDDHEWAARISRNLRGYELAAYGYWGYWKSPGGQDPATLRATFPRLSVYGASARGQVGRGIGNVEVGYYDSRQDRGGDDPSVNNSELRLLGGYERDLPEIAHDFKVAVQYYVELMMHHGRYVRALPATDSPRDFDRHVLTIRLTKLLMNQNLTLSLFAYYSPTDSDAYLRPQVQYKIDDHWTAELGANVLFGAREHTFFGQLARNTNIYASLRYGF
ncbi:MAG TPA: hypothetical protein VMZ50_00385 [Phycisphaerae bacterium]|nr:hypothetical protein [Phycisphaerae bacterium]